MLRTKITPTPNEIRNLRRQTSVTTVSQTIRYMASDRGIRDTLSEWQATARGNQSLIRDLNDSWALNTVAYGIPPPPIQARLWATAVYAFCRMRTPPSFGEAPHGTDTLDLDFAPTSIALAAPVAEKYV